MKTDWILIKFKELIILAVYFYLTLVLFTCHLLTENLDRKLMRSLADKYLFHL